MAILTKFEAAGINVLHHSQTGMNYTINGKDSKYNFSGNILECRLNYKLNSGFFHILNSWGEFLLLRGCRIDYVRNINCTKLPCEKILKEIAEVLGKIASGFKSCNYTIWILYNGVKYAVVSVSDCKKMYGNIPYSIKPLSRVEYEAPFRNSNIRYVSALFNNIFPEYSSTTLWSVLTHNKSAFKIIHGKVYFNYTTLTKAISEGNLSLFESDFISTKYFENVKKKIKVNKVNHKDIEKMIVSIEKKCGTDCNILYENYFNVVHDMLQLLFKLNMFFLEQAYHVADTLKLSIADAVCMAYKTNKNSIFVLGTSIIIPENFDFMSPVCAINPPVTKVLPVKDVMKKLPLIKKTLHTSIFKNLHFLINMRTRLLSTAGKYYMQTEKNFYHIKETLYTAGRIATGEELILFSINEIDNLLKGTYNCKSTCYRKSYFDRIRLQPMPSEIYSKDIPFLHENMREQINVAAAQQKFQFKVYNSLDFEGESSKNMADGEIFCGKNVSLSMLAKSGFPKPKAFILEAAPMFSYIVEYAAINNIPLVYAVKYADKIFADKKIIYKNNILESI